MTWGPFLPGLDPAERKARLRSLRALVKVMTGARGEVVALAILRAEIAPDDIEMLSAAAATFDRLGSIDRRRILSNFAELHAPKLRVVHG